MGSMGSREESKIRKDSLNITQLRRAIKLYENLTFQTKFRSFYSLLTYARLKKVTEYTNKRRFTDREKLMALSLYKKDPRAYKLLTKIFVIPPCHSLHKLTSKVGMELGISKIISTKMQRKTQKMAKLERMCLLLFDEVTIGPSFKSNQRQDLLVKKIRKNDKANHAIVFMIRLLFKKKNQPIAYKFSCGRTTKYELKILIQNIISDLQNCGLRVMATVCDHDARNIGAINKLIRETQQMENKCTCNTFEVNGEEIVPLFDAPHLMKGLRNNLVTKNLRYTMKNKVGIAKWDHVMQFYNNILKSDTRYMKNVTACHVIPHKIYKIDALHAVQTLSSDFGSFIGISSKYGILPAECIDTTYAFLFFERLFKSMNGNYEQWKDNKEDEPLLGLVTPDSVHEKDWTRCKLILNTMKFITSEENEVSTHVIASWIRTLDNIKYLSRKLFVKYKVKAFWMSRFNMDPLVTFLKRFHKYGCRNINT